MAEVTEHVWAPCSQMEQLFYPEAYAAVQMLEWVNLIHSNLIQIVVVQGLV